MGTDEWMTIEEAAAYLKVSRNTIRNYIKSKTLPSYHSGERLIRIKRIDIDTFLKKS